MHFEVTPKPSPAERRAIAAALPRPSEAGPPAYRSAWRRAALERDAEDYAAAPPRSSRGATRA